jgi:hypothetical protein
MTSLVLVRKPSALHIPYFAMAGEPKNHSKHLNLNAALDNPGSPKPVKADYSIGKRWRGFGNASTVMHRWHCC